MRVLPILISVVLWNNLGIIWRGLGYILKEAMSKTWTCELETKIRIIIIPIGRISANERERERERRLGSHDGAERECNWTTNGSVGHC